MIRANCDVCGKVTKGGDDWAGRAARCPNCQAPIYFPAAPPPPTSAPEPSLYDNVVPPQLELAIPQAAAAHRSPAPSFKALETVAKCYDFMGVIAGVIASLLCLLQLVLIATRQVPPVSGLFSVLVSILSGAFTVLFCYAIAENIRLMLQIERNTRTTADVLADLVKAMQMNK